MVRQTHHLALNQCVPKQSAAANSEVDVYPQIVDGRSTKQSPSNLPISYGH
ncbi:hypothetical protein MJO29_005606 [Puccinia striiformis f. sp. tritici]|uniref:hypothetical protein n=1 Tax=Puccinia striiformis f. sp. tritici TaxID=168172 RepID=UPI00200739D1|nr:hypothetical protein Pst134EA_009703 [Puccinia striiformis f. sp. tritici]KAH9458506.1 hypothetical protein Pst134EB_010809 [Puccinia striiformis f. sp. tritici]KAH9469174.1 hypothetical protein Pst134EA_009703 [Puccinia striiformis f. sp. tritici]KAI7960538.1 hypothetical protein MJO29_005606 [Puccinia striiformis f. sp. tritici]KAI9612002.1 hypothetical protein H4Q26_008092 [Puccinia striiformis f. sp. tritici PST-130]